jgi:hypothetical protein
LRKRAAGPCAARDRSPYMHDFIVHECPINPTRHIHGRVDHSRFF